MVHWAIIFLRGIIGNIITIIVNRNIIVIGGNIANITNGANVANVAPGQPRAGKKKCT